MVEYLNDFSENKKYVIFLFSHIWKYMWNDHISPDLWND